MIQYVFKTSGSFHGSIQFLRYLRAVLGFPRPNVAVYNIPIWEMTN